MSKREPCPPSIWAEEEAHLGTLQRHLRTIVQGNKNRAQEAQKHLKAGHFEDQDAWVMHSSLHALRKKSYDSADRCTELIQNPYFGRIDVSDDEATDECFYLCKDDPPAADEQNGLPFRLLPFKYATGAPFVDMLIDRWYKKSTETFEVNGCRYHFKVRRQISVENAILSDVIPEYPLPDGEDDGLTDLFLKKLLRERRKRGQLTDIIATIQRDQFEIIRTDIKKNMIVQGCAGSGKTQILLHRLYYLRDLLKERDWQNVKIITPNKLFGAYSYDELHMLRLSEVEQLSLAEYYRSALFAYDPRFKSRQYDFVLTDESLPDAFLAEVYSDMTRHSIQEAIETSIRDTLNAACALADLERQPPSRDFLQKIVGILGEMHERQSKIEAKLAQGEEYPAHEKGLAQAEKALADLQRQRTAILESVEAQTEAFKKFNSSCKLVEEAAQETRRVERTMASWVDAQRRLIAQFELDYAHTANDQERYVALYRFVSAENELSMFLAGRGRRFKELADETAIFEAIFLDEEKALLRLTGSRSANSYRKRAEEKLDRMRARLTEIDEMTELRRADAMEHRAWIEHALREQGMLPPDFAEANRAREIEGMYHLLSRFESTIFEQHVWRVLESVKQRHGVKTTAQKPAGEEKTENYRILYQADLMYYTTIYCSLYGNSGIPSCKLLCVDEGQDLRPADYELLTRLLPSVVLNIFGDTQQVLHADCGISDWRSVPVAATIHRLNTNYRNSGRIVEFCNQNFQTHMDSLGLDGEEVARLSGNDPLGLRSWLDKRKNRCAVIVKDRAAFEKFSALDAMRGMDFEYLDSEATGPSSDKVNVYSIHAAKGLEYPSAMVLTQGMTRNQKYVACTRAMSELAYCE